LNKGIENSKKKGVKLSGVWWSKNDQTSLMPMTGDLSETFPQVFHTSWG